MTANDPARERLEDEAVRWFGRMCLTTPSAGERERFERWYTENPANKETYDRARDIWGHLRDLSELPEARALLEETARVAAGPDVMPSGSFRRYFAQTALAASVLIAAILGFLYLNAPLRYATEVAEIRALNLPDGSRVTLGARSRIALRFSETERRLHLEGGEAFFEVRKDPARPFIVDAGNAWVRVLGTKFDIRRGEDRVNVAVLEGTVEVGPSASFARASPAGNQEKTSPANYLLNAGQQLTTGKALARAHPRPISPAVPPGAWRGGRLSYDGARLAEVLADVNRYYPAGVELTSESLADLKVTTAFNVDQIEAMINSLTQALPLAARRDSNGRVVLSPSLDQK